MSLEKLSMDETKSSPAIGVSLFLELPPEIHLRICDFIPRPSLKNLRLASQRTAAFLSERDLVRQHQRCCTETLEQEHEIRRNLIRAAVTNLILDLLSAVRRLPCYKCLQWKPGADKLLETSAFTRRMSIFNGDVGSPEAVKRLCIDCGIQTGFYGRGCRVGYRMMCRGCHKKLSKLPGGSWPKKQDPNIDWKEFKYCVDCLEMGGLHKSKFQWQHEMRWGKYERGIREGRLYRDEKGRVLREEGAFCYLKSN